MTTNIMVTIEGTGPLLMHRFSEQAEADVEKTTRKAMVQTVDRREVAEQGAYRLPDGRLYVPATWIIGTLASAGSNHKQRGSRKSLRYLVPAAVRMADITLPLHVAGEIATGNPAALREFEVDSRPVTIPATKGKVMRHRPRLDTWALSFTIKLNESLLEPKTLHQLLSEAGEQFGIGDFRPTFGCFRVTYWQEITDADKPRSAKNGESAHA